MQSETDKNPGDNVKNILEMLEQSAERLPEKTAFSDTDEAFTYAELEAKAKSIGTAIANKGICKKPVALIFERSAKNIAAMLGVLYSGNFYTVIDSEMPTDRINTIFKDLKPAAVLISEKCVSKAEELNFNGLLIYYNDAVSFAADEAMLSEIRSGMTGSDPAYTLFTSGSTGVPKGAVVSHSSVLAYVDWYSKAFNIGESTVFGSQTPFYFSMSVSDVFSTINTGATLHVIPKMLFSFPMKLLEFLNERKVNTIYWVPSALCIIANWKVLDYENADYLKTVLFAGEVMPVKQLNYWRRKLPEALFANLFGPTETTDICTYYVVDRDFEDTETLPIGKSCDNCDVFLINEDGKEAKSVEEGELYVRGPFLALGYYNNPEKTAAAFVQNPLNTAYPETVYKTGDIVKYNDKGELLYLTRADFQIKHMGYRIELGEVEAAAGAVSGFRSCAAVYDAAEDRIVLVYEGKKQDDGEILSELSKHLPDYMMPGKIVRTKTMPYNQNGKIDRKLLNLKYKEL